MTVRVCLGSRLGCSAPATPAEALGLSGEASRELVTPFSVAESQRGVSRPRLRLLAAGVTGLYHVENQVW